MFASFAEKFKKRGPPGKRNVLPQIIDVHHVAASDWSTD
jgi:hypothetical protein